MANNYGGLITETINPFGRAGAINTTGAIYGTTVSTSGSTSFIEVENVTVSLPTNAMVKELKVGLTIGLALTATTDSPKVTYNIKDSAQTSYDTLVAFTSTTLMSLVSTTTLVDFSAFGNKTPSDGTYFTGKSTFNVQATVAANASTSKVQGAVKQSSYIQYSYYLIG